MNNPVKMDLDGSQNFELLQVKLVFDLIESDQPI
jgi:hypothetical protein